MDKARRQKTTKRPVLAMLDCIRPRHPHCPPARRYRLYTLSSSAPMKMRTVSPINLNARRRCEVPRIFRAGVSCRHTVSASAAPVKRSEEHTSELQSLMRISYAVLFLQKKKQQ